MKKYSKKMLYDYIIGNDLNGYNIDELENDYEFMMQVMDFSKDKKLYDLFDNNLKGNFELVKFLINKFSDDKEFCKKVALNFSTLSEDEKDLFEIDIIMGKLIGTNVESLLDNPFYISAKNKYDFLRSSYLVEFRNEKDMKEYFQMGFDIFVDAFVGRENIINYIAENMVDEIFNIENKSVEELIHSYFKSKQKIGKIGIVNFILRYIEKHDITLSRYLQTNIKLIDNIKNEIEKAYINFDIYNEKKNNQLISWMIDYLINYTLETSYLSGSQLIKYISKDLGINSPLIDKELEDYDDLLDEYDYPSCQNDKEYQKLLATIRKVLRANEEPDDYEEQNENMNSCKIITFKKNN